MFNYNYFMYVSLELSFFVNKFVFSFTFRFCELVSSALSADSAHPHPLTELADQVTEYEYEIDEKTGQSGY